MYSFSNLRRVSAVLPFAAVLAFAFVFAAPAHAATNLITNGDLASSTTVGATTTPDHFVFGGFDDIATPSYFSTGGPSGTDAYVSFTTTSHTDGDRKWVNDAVTVTPGALYTFSDSYRADVDSYVVAAYIYPGGVAHYQQLAILSSTGGTWKTVTADFTAPQVGSPLTVQIFHLLKTNGTLATAHYSLTTFSNTANDLFTTPIISLTFDDGWATQYNEAFPLLKSNSFAGTFFIISNPLLAASYDFFTDPNESIIKTDNSWSPIYTDPTNKGHRFAVTYTSTDTVNVVATYPLSTTTTAMGTTTIGTLPAGTDVRGSLTFSLPAQTTGTDTVTPITITMTPVSGTLTTSNPVLNEYSEEGYMSADQLKDLAGAAVPNEIAAHTVSHCSLLTLGACAFTLPLGATAQSEISNSVSQIASASSITPVTLAYPYGDYDSAIESDASALAGARTVDFGYNRLTTDKFALKSQSVDASTTVPEVENWIDTAIANHFWLILTFHQVDTPANILKNGEDTGVTPQDLTSIINYIKGKGNAVEVKTVAQGLSIMGNTVIDNSAPIITLNGTASTSVTVGTAYTDAGATAVDQPGNVSVPVTTTYTFGAVATSSVNTNVIGTYTVHYNAQDTATVPNHATEVTRTVNVIAQAPAPVLSSEAQGSVSDTSVTIIWTTDHAATSRVVWGTSSVIDASTTEAGAPNYGYTNSTAEDAALVTSHSVTVSGLSANTTYYFRPVSHGSPEAIGKEVTATTASAPVVTPPSNGGGSSGSGSGGGGGGIVSGPFSIGYVNTNPVGLSLPGAVLGASTNCYVFNTTLQVGSTGADVSALQSRLTLEGLFSANATGYFGSITKAAVMAFQAKNNVESVGIVGPKTRAILNGSCPVGAPGSATQPVVTAPSAAVFTQNLMVGSIGAEVTLLQKVLIDLGFLKIATPTGYFGSLTKAAVMGYQTSRGIEATGNTGPKTRAALNSNAGAVTINNTSAVLSSEK